MGWAVIVGKRLDTGSAWLGCEDGQGREAEPLCSMEGRVDWRRGWNEVSRALSDRGSGFANACWT